MTEEEILLKLRNLLKNHINLLKGDFVSKNSGYEEDICKKIPGFKKNKSRYWDCVWQAENLYIEFKKGQSIWLDLVRYGEIFLKKSHESKRKTFTLFFIPNKERTKISEIIGVKTDKLIKRINLSSEQWKFILDISKIVPRSLNAQAKLIIKDVKYISKFIIP